MCWVHNAEAAGLKAFSARLVLNAIETKKVSDAVNFLYSEDITCESLKII